jgi:3'(2'), 5'-bisphosphate nucleotidase
MLENLERAAIEAGQAILAIEPSELVIAVKHDLSPVTIADQRSEAVIAAFLARAYPGVPVIAEEATTDGEPNACDADAFFLVDPLDGTKEFIEQSGDYTVNIALVEKGVPSLGVVYAPARRMGYSADRVKAQKFLVTTDGVIVHRTDIRCRARGGAMTAVASRSHSNEATQAFLTQHAITSCLSIGSSLKFCLIAEGFADVYPRYGRTMEWDTAAGDAILRAAGGMTALTDGAPLTYGKRRQVGDCDYANPHFIAWGSSQ